LDPFYTDHPATCWCDESKLVKIALGAKQDDYVTSRGRYDVPETFKLVSYQAAAPTATVTKGWAREHALGDFYKDAHRPSKNVVPKNLDEALTAAAHEVLPAATEVADLGVVQDASESWVHVGFRDPTGGEVSAWARAAELGSASRNRYVLTAPLPDLLNKAPA